MNSNSKTVDSARALASVVRDPIAFVRGDLRAVWANAAAAALFGTSEDAETALPSAEAESPPVSLDGTTRGWRDLVARLIETPDAALRVSTFAAHQGGQVFECRLVRHADGWLLAATPVPFQTQQARSDEEAESRYKSLIEHVPGAFYRCAYDADWTMQFISDAIAGIAGYPPSDFFLNRVRTYTSIIHPDDVAMVDQTLAKAVEARAPFHVEYRLIHRDGRIIWVEETGAAVFNEASEVLFLDGFIRDTTSLRTARALLHESEGEATAARLHAEAALAEVESYRAALDHHAMVAVTDGQGKILRANPKFLRRFGYKATELIGRSFDVFDPHTEDQTKVRRFTHTIDTKTLWQGDLAVRTKTGERFWIAATLVRIVDSHSKEQQHVGIFEDITDRKENERRLHEEHQRLQLALDGGDLGLWDWHVAPHTVSYDARWASMLGEDIATLPQTFASWEQRVHPDDLAAAQTRIEACVRNESDKYEWTGRMKHADGSWRWILARGGVVGRDAAGLPVRIVGTHADVTAHVSVQRALTDQIAKLETAEIQAGMGHWTWDRESNQIRWSTNLFSLHGRPIDQGMPTYQEMLSCFTPEAQTTLANSVVRAVSEKIPYRVRVRAKRDEPQWVECSARVIDGDDGSVEGLVGTCTDVTERVLGEEALKAAMARVEAATRAKSEFLANMSHEIRSPLTAILGYAEILRDDYATRPNEAAPLNAAETIMRAGHHLLAIINDILDLSKIEAGHMNLDSVEIHLADIFRDVVSLTRPRTTEKGLLLSVTAKTDLPADVYGDPKRLRQILMNLVGNAVKFTDSGRIEITAAQEPHQDPQWLVIDVADSGVGIPPEAATLLFDPFSQVDGSTSRRHEGTGLGLNICRRLVGLMGGTIRLLWSDPGNGSCFRVELPLRPVPGTRILSDLDSAASSDQPTTGQRLARPAIALNGRVLVVDDGEANQALFRLHLERAGAIVVTADDGREALGCFAEALREEKPFDLILTDIQMPEMDGYELTRSLRASGCVTPIIALTAHAMAEDRRRCLDAGCDDYISKPIDKASLIRRCAEWLGRRSHAVRPKE